MKITDKVQTLLRRVDQQGDQAVAALLRRWDGVDLKPSQWRVPAFRLAQALKNLAPVMREALTLSARNIEVFHQEEKRRVASSWRLRRGGLIVGQEIRPVDSVGLYVPGGRFAYPSTVLMTAIPARAAGVKRLVMVTPPRHLTPEVMAAAALAGVNELYQIGGVAAVGALAMGTKTVKRVDLIVGPGGAWVTEAKRQVFGRVGIDILAGPSEIVLLADESAPADFVAGDIMAQAEHDPLSRCVLVSPSAGVLKVVRAAVAPRFRPQCRFIKAAGWDAAIDVVNNLAPEHLSLMVKNPESLVKRVKNAGAIFLGPWSPVAAGDYWAGPSHVLPTGRSARFSSGLSVQTFMKRSSVIGVSRGAMRKNAEAVARLAAAEGLEQHAASLLARGKGFK